MLKPFRDLSLVSIWSWLTAFALLPLLGMIVMSFLAHDDSHFYLWRFTTANLSKLFSATYLHIFLNSFTLALLVTAICLLIGYPFAYFLTRCPTKWKPLLALLVIVPFWTSSLLRSYAIIMLIKANGILNYLLLSMHLISKPLMIMYTHFAVTLGLVYNLLPFVILPLFTNMEKLDWRLLEAARDLGANRWTIIWRVLLPMTKTGIFSAILMTLLPAMTLFYIPDLMGGAKSLLLGNVIQMQFLEARNWPMGAALSVMLTLVMSLLLLVYWRISQKDDYT